MELIGRGYPNAYCTAKVTVTAPGTQTREFREEKARRRGHAVDECGDRAEYAHDGDDLCPKHAGAVALRLVMAQAGNPVG